MLAAIPISYEEFSNFTRPPFLVLYNIVICKRRKIRCYMHDVHTSRIIFMRRLTLPWDYKHLFGGRGREGGGLNHWLKERRTTLIPKCIHIIIWKLQIIIVQCNKICLSGKDNPRKGIFKYSSWESNNYCRLVKWVVVERLV